MFQVEGFQFPHVGFEGGQALPERLVAHHERVPLLLQLGKLALPVLPAPLAGLIIKVPHAPVAHLFGLGLREAALVGGVVDRGGVGLLAARDAASGQAGRDGTP